MSISLKDRIRFFFKDHFAIMDELIEKFENGDSSDEDLKDWELCMAKILDSNVKDKVWKAQNEKYAKNFRKYLRKHYPYYKSEQLRKD